MSQIAVIGEDRLSCALGERLVAETLPGWSLARTSIDTGGVTKLVASMSRYAQYAANVCPVLCIADTDGACAVALLQKWLPRGASERFVFRLAVSEAESWVLADRQGAAAFFDVPVARIPVDPDALGDPKMEILKIARKSRVRNLRMEVVAGASPARPGTGYNVHLRQLVLEQWSPTRAAQHSPSLRRAMVRLTELRERLE